MYSKNKKLNALLTAIEGELLLFGIDEIKRYRKEFPKEIDYNIAQYGNLLVYYDQVRGFYKLYGYKVDKWSNNKLWQTYKCQVGYIARELLNEHS